MSKSSKASNKKASYKEDYLIAPDDMQVTVASLRAAKKRTKANGLDQQARGALREVCRIPSTSKGPLKLRDPSAQKRQKCPKGRESAHVVGLNLFKVLFNELQPRSRCLTWDAFVAVVAALNNDDNFECSTWYENHKIDMPAERQLLEWLGVVRQPKRWQWKHPQKSWEMLEEFVLLIQATQLVLARTGKGKSIHLAELIETYEPKIWELRDELGLPAGLGLPA